MSSSPEVTAAEPARTGWRMWTRTQVYVLLLLMLLNMSNYLDRGIISILQEPMKHDLGLQDWQLGMISGPAFALLYSVAGIPIARFADRSNRITLLSIALAVWSTLTAVCGLATSFAHLVLARIGVGAAEGACTPTSHSLIADTFEPRQRGLALSILTTSIPVAQLIAPLIGGVVAMTLGWRAAFVIVGLPGLALALLLWLTVRDPRHAAKAEPAQPRNFFADMRTLFAKRSFFWLFVASAFMGMSITATNAFTASYFLRQYHFTLAEVGALMAAGLGIAGLTGTFLGGWMADRYAGSHGRSYPWTCAFGAVLASLFFVIVFTADNWLLAIPFLLLANISTDLKNGPNTAVAQNIAPPGMRSTTSAVMMLAVVAIGATLGPLIIGTVSDIAAARAFPDLLGDFVAMCPGGKPIAGGAASLGEACAAASAQGLRTALLIPCVTYVLAGASFYMCGRVIEEPLEK
ncbi:MFS transporter [Sphingomonas gilva]|uniref:MFS transporter n=1 Tax=Sphingomonas gilva TaxID=2305907 RepID=A0A396S773_9SPHN|nr:MFS transporter [Sphingomonas gilva]RHW19245.1 MFS transporter [Sphingomonas gilva]